MRRTKENKFPRDINCKENPLSLLQVVVNEEIASGGTRRKEGMEKPTVQTPGDEINTRRLHHWHRKLNLTNVQNETSFP